MGVHVVVIRISTIVDCVAIAIAVAVAVAIAITPSCNIRMFHTYGGGCVTKLLS